MQEAAHPPLQFLACEEEIEIVGILENIKIGNTLTALLNKSRLLIFILPFFSYIKGIKIVDFFNIYFGNKLTMFANVLQ